jgi:hypothetical protein
MSLSDIKGDNVAVSRNTQDPSVNIDTLCFPRPYRTAQDVDSAKALRADIETAKATLDLPCSQS